MKVRMYGSTEYPITKEQLIENFAIIIQLELCECECMRLPVIMC